MATEIQAMLNAWNNGDAVTVAKMIQQSDDESPAFFKLMFTDRNARWVEVARPAARKAGHGVHGGWRRHLAGDRVGDRDAQEGRA